MIYEFQGKRPRLGKNVFVAPGAILLGDVTLEDEVNIWFNTVVRGDVNSITIGAGTNIQDMCMLHVTSGKYPLIIGSDVIVGHRAVLHGCTIKSEALIGIGALVLDGAVIEQGAIVAAGAVVSPGTIIPSNRVAVGIPARATRNVSTEERQFNQINLQKYKAYAHSFSENVKECGRSD
jgi:gamma-carbonic anhydrase